MVYNLAAPRGHGDIYLPDSKYADAAMASAYTSGADTYLALARSALVEMNRQVGVARPVADGLMYRGLMIRHLVMPNGVSGSREVFEWIAANLPRDTYVNVMSQYRLDSGRRALPDYSAALTSSTPVLQPGRYRRTGRGSGPIARQELRSAAESSGSSGR